MYKRCEKTKALIKENLIELLKTKDINRITIKELTDKCNICRKTFYLHYQTIYFAVEDIENDIMNIIDDLFSKLYKNGKTPDFNDFAQILNSVLISNKPLIEFLRAYKNSDVIKRKIKNSAIEIIKKNSSLNKSLDYADFIFDFTIGGMFDAIINNSGEIELSDERLSEISVELVKKCFELIEKK